jgi:hypothetical protein
VPTQKLIGGMFRVVIGVLVIISLAVPVLAQIPTGEISGVVKDASGAAVPGAMITAVNLETAQSRTAVTGQDGAFLFSAMRVGHYNLQSALSYGKYCRRPKPGPSDRRPTRSTWIRRENP